jgi:putative transposase
MPSHAFHQLYYHMVWSTKNRLPLITGDMRQRVIEWVTDECHKRGGTPVACNAMPDHLHLLVNLPPTVCVATFIGQVKGASSYACNHHFGARHYLAWQDGYGALTVRKGESEKITFYVLHQQDLHAEGKTSPLWENTETDE